MTEQKILTNVRLTPLHRAIFQRLGGVKWLRMMLELERKKVEKSS